MSNLITRVTSGIIYIALFVFATLYCKESFILLTLIFGIISVFEFSKMIQLKSIVPYLFLLFFGYITLKQPQNHLIWIPLSLTLICAIRLIFYLFSNQQNYPTHRFEKLDLIVRYIVFSFLFLLLLPFSKGNYNPYIIIGILILIWVNDSFAYLIGKNLGSKKLFERISPRKTIEGFFGGVFFAIASSFILSNYITVLSTVNWVVIAVLTAILGTLGDLIESKFKRRAGIKDSGTIMPGHGGILDRLDSLLFVAPFVYLYLYYCV